MLLALALWLYSFYRLYLVWQNTLNFQESSIQGPQGWDLLVNWNFFLETKGESNHLDDCIIVLNTGMTFHFNSL